MTDSADDHNQDRADRIGRLVSAVLLAGLAALFGYGFLVPLVFG